MLYRLHTNKGRFLSLKKFDKDLSYTPSFILPNKSFLFKKFKYLYSILSLMIVNCDFFFETGSCSGWPQTGNPASAFPSAEIQACTTTPIWNSLYVKIKLNPVKTLFT
jgi:hypothetical protein